MVNNKYSKFKNIYFLLDLKSLSVFIKIHEQILILFNKKKINIHLVDINFKIENRNNFKTEKKIFNFLKIYQPKNIVDLKNYIQKKRGVIVKNYVDLFSYYRINLTLKKINYNIIEIANLGNIQQSEFFYIKKNIYFFKKIFVYWFPIKLSVVLYCLGLFKKISIRFESNYNTYKGFQKNKKKNFFLRIPSKYLEMINVKSTIIEKFSNKKISNKYITLLEFDPNYIEEKRSMRHSKKKLDEYYIRMNKVLGQIGGIFNKEVVICIHPLYDSLEIQKRYKNFKVYKHRTEEFIRNSELVMFFDSSAIMDAIALKKKILTIKSKIYQGKKNKSNLYSNILNTFILNIDRPIFYSKYKFLKILNNKIKNYNKFLKVYGSSQARYGQNEILKKIKTL